MVRRGWPGTARHGTARPVSAWRGLAGMARHGWQGAARVGRGEARQGSAWLGMAWQARFGEARSGAAWRGLARLARFGLAWLGRHGGAWQDRARSVSAGLAWCGAVWPGTVRRGRARLAWPGSAQFGQAQQGQARLGEARLARLGVGWQGTARCGATGTRRVPTPPSALHYKTNEGAEVKLTTTESPPLNGHADFDVDAAASKAADKAANSSQARVEIEAIGRETILVPIVGTNSLIVHKFGAKARREMLGIMQGRKKQKEHKDPDADFLASLYRFEDGGYGFPAIAFKAATVGACRYYGKELSMVACRQIVFIKGERNEDGQQMVRIIGEPQMREDVVRLKSGGADLRYRPEFMPWSATLQMTYVTGALSRESVVSLIDAGGMGVGVGEWRPERGGDFGTYTIDKTRSVTIVEIQGAK